MVGNNVNDRFDMKILRHVAARLAKDLPALESIDYWASYKWELGAKLVQATFDRPGGAMKFEDYKNWVDGSKTVTRKV